jgi:type I restriction enzyme S subunit
MKMNKVKLGDIAIFGNGVTIPKEKGEVPAFGGNGITDYVNSSNSNDETIIIGRVGAYCGSVHYYKGNCWITDNALYIKVKQDINAKFLSHYLKLTNLNKVHIGSSQPLITQGILEQLEIQIPSIQTQTVIASILSFFDNKIELNNKINKELENLAKTIYDYWFVQNTDKRWEREKVGNLLIKHADNSLHIDAKNIFKIGKHPVITQDVGDLIKGYTNEENPIIDLPALIFGDHSCTLRYIDFPFFRGADGTQLLYFENEKIPMYSYFSLEKLIPFLPNFGKYERHFKYLKELHVFIPPTQILQEFNKIVLPIFSAINRNRQESNVLAQLRDFLLPLLLNGQVKVKNG